MPKRRPPDTSYDTASDSEKNKWLTYKDQPRVKHILH